MCEFEGSYMKSEGTYQDNILSRMIHHNISSYCTKVSVNACVSQALAIVTEMSIKIAIWMVLKNGCID